MNLLEAIEKHNPVKIGDFTMNCQFDGENFVIQGEFTKDGESTYAHYKKMNLVAGSQDKDSEISKIKALGRLIQLLNTKLLEYKKEKALEPYLKKNCREDLVRSFQLYASYLEKRETSKSKKIQVFIENVESSEGQLSYTIQDTGKTVSNMDIIQEAKQEMLSNGSVPQTIKFKPEESITRKIYSVSV